MSTRTPGLPWNWGATTEEIEANYPCEGLVDPPRGSAWRAVTIEASAEVVFRWLGQLRTAPYSYDLLDNLGRRSPRRMPADPEPVEVGQEMMVFEIVGVEPDREITGTSLPRATRMFGPLAATYRIVPIGPQRSRLVARLDIGGSGIVSAVRRPLLAWGDVVMMRKQLLTLKHLAERDARVDA